MTSVFIHVGPHKTGTTFLQNRVFPRLDGIFDATGRVPELWHALRELADENPLLVDLDAAKHRVRQVLGAIAEDKVVISWERLSGDPYRAFFNNGSTARHLKAVCPDASLIFVVRRQDSYAESLYKQTLRAAWSIPVDRFVGLRRDGTLERNLITSNYGFPSLDVRALDWSVYIANYERLFGADKVKVLVYEDLVADRDAFVRALCAHLGVSAPALPDAAWDNRGYSALSMRISYVLNRFRQNPHKPRGRYRKLAGRAAGWPRMREALRRRLSLDAILGNTVDRYLYRPGTALSEHTRARILREHHAANAVLDMRLNLGLKRHGYY